MKKIIIILGLFVTIQTFSQNINDSLLIHYTLDGNINDYSGNGFDGISNGVTYTEDRFGNTNSACYFDGINDYIGLPNLSQLKPNLPVSFSFWIKYDGNSNEDRAVFNTSFEEDISAGVCFTSQNITGKYAVGYGDGSDFYSVSTRRTFVSNSIIETNSWHHITIMVNSALNMKIYVDCNESEGQYSGTGGNLKYSLSQGCIGRHDQNVIIPAYYFKGSIYDFRYWNRELTIEEVDTLCKDLIPGDPEVPDSTMSELKIYPNPANKIIYLKTDYTNLKSIIIYNSLGKQVYTGPFEQILNVEKFSSGFYYLKVLDNFNTVISSHKLIINNIH